MANLTDQRGSTPSLVAGGRRWIRKAARSVDWRFRRQTAPARLLPDFIVIGAQKGGTSSLYQYLIQHPWVAPPQRKEVHFFDTPKFSHGINLYRAHFPLRIYRSYIKGVRSHDIITGEASPYYIFYPHAPRRIASILPHIKIIAMLRNPVDRAFSHYFHQVKKGREELSFEEALSEEEARLRGEREKVLQDEDYYSYNLWAYSYLARGIYVDQLWDWLSVFSEEQMYIIDSERFFADPAGQFENTLRFLELPSHHLSRYEKHNAGGYGEMSKATRRRLQEYFKPHNERLYELLGFDFGWDV